MNTIRLGVAHCGSCRFYSPVGRRGGDCSQLGVLVKSTWNACCLAQDPFSQDALHASDLINSKDLSTLLSTSNIRDLPQSVPSTALSPQTALSTPDISELSATSGS